MPLLEYDNATYSNEGKTIIDNISISIEQGDFISIMGPSGSGKSTFLKLCCHLISPTAGSISFRGRDMLQYDPLELRKRISYCFQMPYLFGSNVADNFYFPYSIRSMKPDRQRIGSLLEDFNLPSGILETDVKNLSGGEKQRIALIRTLLFSPEILLLDEATSALDTENTRIVEDIIVGLNREGVTILLVTHNPEQDRRHAHRLITIESGRLASVENLQK